MLCDDIAAMYGGKTAVALSGAERFLLQRDAVTAAVNVSLTKPSSLIRGIGLCKAPYRSTWLEWAMAAQMDASGIPGQSGRCGLLLHADETLMNGWGNIFFGAKPDGTPQLFPGFRFDYREQFDKSAPRAPEIPIPFSELSESDQAALRELATRHPMAGSAEGADAGVRINQALIGMSFLMLLNSRNSVETVTVDVSRINRARQKSGKAPFFTYRTVDLSFSKTQRNRVDALALSSEQKRLHLVRGHFKVRTTGVFWWMPHVRGDLAVGFADKDYGVRR